MRIGRSYVFQASHRLPNVPADHKCGRLHGHTYGLDVELLGEVASDCGWVVDFGDLDAAVQEHVIKVLDHRHLNEVPGLENPTSERLVVWVLDALSRVEWPHGVRLSRVAVHENNRSWAAWQL